MMNPLKMFSEWDENVLINYILDLDEGRWTTTTNAATVLKQLTFHVLLGEIEDYFKVLYGINTNTYDPSLRKYIFDNEHFKKSVQYHFKGIDNLVENYYETITHRVRIYDPENWMTKTQLIVLIEQFRPLLFRYKKIYEANQDYFLPYKEFYPRHDPDRFIAVYAFTKIVHFNLNSDDLNSFFTRLPRDRFIILRMGNDGILKLSAKNLSTQEKLIHHKNLKTINIMSILHYFQKDEFPDNSRENPVALIGAPGYTDIDRMYTKSSSWRVSEVLQVLRDHKGFKDFFFFVNQMIKTDNPGELKGKTFLVMIDGEPHIFNII